MNEQAPTPEPTSSSLLAQSSIVLAVLAMVAAGWQWWDYREKSRELQVTLSQRLSQFEDRNSESHVRAKRAEETAGQAAARVTLLEQRLEASRAQQEALQTLYLELANNRDEWVISEVEQLLIIASQQLQLASNVKPALLALQTADARLQHLDKPQIVTLRKVLAQDIQRLQALPNVDFVGMNLKLENLIAATDKLPLASDRHPRLEPIHPNWEANPWRQLAQEIWLEIRKMVRIERVDQPEMPLLEPDQAYFLRENLKLRLLSARIALLQHDEATYRTDIQLATDWLKRYFNTQDPNGRHALMQLEQLSSSKISIEIPDIGASLNAVSTFKRSLERTQP